MKIVIAPDSFKGSLSASQVCECLERGVLKAAPDASVVKLPVSDGGEGLVEVMVAATGGDIVRVTVQDPLGRDVESFFGITGGGDTAVIEMAAASGLPLLDPGERNPMKTSTFGTGQLMMAALERGVRKILMGIGGSATNDCGAGMAAALGMKFPGRDGRDAGPGGGELGEVERIVPDDMDGRIAGVAVEVACDVTNPLTGEEGASAVYGPQKGADPEMVAKLDRNLKHMAGLIRRDLNRDVENLPGAGAAGGLGAGLAGFCNAVLRPGIEMVLDNTGFDEELRDADLVITGEGRMDPQTLFGKVPVGVAMRARRHGCPVVAVNGSYAGDLAEIHHRNIAAYFSITSGPATEEETFADTPNLLETTAEQVMRTMRIFHAAEKCNYSA